MHAGKGVKIMATIREIIARYVRDAGKPDAKFLRRLGSKVYVGDDGLTLYSFGSHFPLAKLQLTPRGKRSYWLLNGDHWSRGWGVTTRHQQLTRDEVGKTGLPVLILPFEALRRAGIDRHTIKPVEIKEERWETIVETARAWDQVPLIHRYSAGPGMVPASAASHFARQGEDGIWRWKTQRHWLGASVFRATYDTGEWKRGDDGYDRRVTATAYFLSAFDENEPNPLYFLAQMPKGARPKTVEDALEALKPAQVKQAEAAGAEILRQGDVFAIPTSWATRLFTHNHAGRKRGAYVLNVNHTATESAVLPAGDVFARGILRHRPREPWRNPEHRRVKLGDGKQWYRLVKNTVPEGRSWSMAGNVD
jgi:hypothetical protein